MIKKFEIFLSQKSPSAKSLKILPSAPSRRNENWSVVDEWNNNGFFIVFADFLDHKINKEV